MWLKPYHEVRPERKKRNAGCIQETIRFKCFKNDSRFWSRSMSRSSRGQGLIRSPMSPTLAHRVSRFESQRSPMSPMLVHRVSRFESQRSPMSPMSIRSPMSPMLVHRGLQGLQCSQCWPNVCQGNNQSTRECLQCWSTEVSKVSNVSNVGPMFVKVTVKQHENVSNVGP